ncbi:MAG TPA: thrombospondin type 3 repeat-containing protein, partial [Candidatus Paceibacterota bacterium]|nr:thrombospondin type 3 repeat-containing protein [Candidatus Paceibacterota bacterium]
AVDRRIVKSVRTGTVAARPGPDIETDLGRAGYSKEAVAELIRLIPLGIITDPSQVGGYPKYKGAPRKDSDGDGMPDGWEKKYHLNPNDPSDAAKDADADGYTNVEEFLNGTDPIKFVDYTKLENNVDTLK